MSFPTQRFPATAKLSAIALYPVIAKLEASTCPWLIVFPYTDTLLDIIVVDDDVLTDVVAVCREIIWDCNPDVIPEKNVAFPDTFADTLLIWDWRPEVTVENYVAFSDTFADTLLICA